MSKVIDQIGNASPELRDLHVKEQPDDFSRWLYGQLEYIAARCDHADEVIVRFLGILRSVEKELEDIRLALRDE